MVLYRSVRLRMTNVSHKVADIIKTFIVCSVMFFRTSFFYETLWNKYRRAGQFTDDNTAHVPCMLDTEEVMLIPSPLQQWLLKRPSILRYTYIAFLVEC